MVNTRLYKHRDAQGLCVLCGKNPQSANSKRCPDCASIISKTRKATRTILMGQKICVECKINSIKFKDKYCEGCYLKNKQANQQLHLKRLSKKNLIATDSLKLKCVQLLGSKCKDCGLEMPIFKWLGSKEMQVFTTQLTD